MSNKTQLQINNTNLDALITRVNAAKDTAASLPEAGGSGGSSGGGVETCTINISVDAPVKLLMYGYSYVSDDGKVMASYTDCGAGISGGEIVLNNVVCGSYIYIGCLSSWLAVSYDNVIPLWQPDYTPDHFRAPTVGGSTGTINFFDDD